MWGIELVVERIIEVVRGPLRGFDRLTRLVVWVGLSSPVRSRFCGWGIRRLYVPIIKAVIVLIARVVQSYRVVRLWFRTLIGLYVAGRQRLYHPIIRIIIPHIRRRFFDSVRLRFSPFRCCRFFHWSLDGVFERRPIILIIQRHDVVRSIRLCSYCRRRFLLHSIGRLLSCIIRDVEAWNAYILILVLVHIVQWHIFGERTGSIRFYVSLV
ncbi:hypothetical protein DF196_07055 [Bifidobacterium callitrichidarum]|uniref:Uncharacterized protein n=1 Tax=Bifidobacterium callitrichidarum TaxID=2052941 RepID=A0A2U2N944_9BIFI|nr:hypothetical protein DF196_07055 [Bifidobacterium callitrichidarum]